VTDEERRAAMALAREKIALGIQEFLEAADWNVMRPDDEEYFEGASDEDRPSAPVHMVLGEWLICGYQQGLDSDGLPFHSYPLIMSNPRMPGHIGKGLLEQHLEAL
jgi:hypothetical protein